MKSNFWLNVEAGMLSYLNKNLDLFLKEYQQDNTEKISYLDNFVKEFSDKKEFESLYNTIRASIKNVFDKTKEEILGTKKPEEVEQKKLNTLICLTKLLNSFIIIPRFLNDFSKKAKENENGSVDLNNLFVEMAQPEIKEINRIFIETKLAKLDMSLDNTIKAVEISKDSLPIWPILNQLGLYLQREIELKNFTVEKQKQAHRFQIENLERLVSEVQSGKIEIPNFNKEKAIDEINKHNEFILSLTPEQRLDLSSKAEEFRNKILPLVQLIQHQNELLIIILDKTNILAQEKKQ